MKEEIEEIIGQFDCPKGFKCYKSGFENLCKAGDIGLETFLLCLEPSSTECPFAVPVGIERYCDCPLRVYIAKKLNK